MSRCDDESPRQFRRLKLAMPYSSMLFLGVRARYPSRKSKNRSTGLLPETKPSTALGPTQHLETPNLTTAMRRRTSLTLAGGIV